MPQKLVLAAAATLVGCAAVAFLLDRRALASGDFRAKQEAIATAQGVTATSVNRGSIDEPKIDFEAALQADRNGAVRLLLTLENRSDKTYRCTIPWFSPSGTNLYFTAAFAVPPDTRWESEYVAEGPGAGSQWETVQLKPGAKETRDFDRSANRQSDPPARSADMNESRATRAGLAMAKTPCHSIAVLTFRFNVAVGFYPALLSRSWSASRQRWPNLP